VARNRTYFFVPLASAPPSAAFFAAAALTLANQRPSVRQQMGTAPAACLARMMSACASLVRWNSVPDCWSENVS
jgi:hypothetical protein